MDHPAHACAGSQTRLWKQYPEELNVSTLGSTINVVELKRK